MVKKIKVFFMIFLIILALFKTPIIIFPSDYQIKAISGGENESSDITPFMPGEIIVEFNENITLTIIKNSETGYIDTGNPSLDQLNKLYQVTSMEKIFNKDDVPSLSFFYKLFIPTDTDINQAVIDYSNDPLVSSAGPNYLFELCEEPNDPYYYSSGSWGQDYSDLYGLHNIKTDNAWNLSIGSEDILVAVIDTGIDYYHPDFSDNIWINDDEIPYNDIDDDEDGFTDNLFGADFYYNDSDPMDGNGHGTHCAGTIAAVGNNILGVVGVNWQAKIMAVKAFSDSHGSTSDILANALCWAADQGADILSNSWGPDVRQPSIPVIEAAVQYAFNLGCLLVFSAMNEEDDVQYYCPQNMNETVAVAAIDHNDIKANFSNWGEKIAVSAPGVDILSLRANNTNCGNYENFIVEDNYYRLSGTSMACPHVAGLGALILSLVPNLTNVEIASLIESTADNIDSLNPGYEGLLGSGRINVTNATYQAIQVYDHNIRVRHMDIIPSTRYISDLFSSRLGLNETVIVNASLVNIGQYNETNATVRFCINDEEEENITLQFLERYHTYYCNFTWSTPTIAGEYNLTINVSIQNISEFYDDNNLTKKVAVGVQNLFTKKLFATIQSAINDSNTTDGDILIVPKDALKENIVITKNISLVGIDGKNNTFIEGNVSNLSTIYISNLAFVNITGFTIRNGSSGVFISNSSNVTIAETSINNNNISGITLNTTNNITITNCKINNNTNNGIYLLSSENTMCEFNNISNNKNGIFINLSKNSTIENCTIFNNMNLGIKISNNSNNNTVIENDIIENNRSISIVLNCADNFIYHNNFINNTLLAEDYCNNNQWDNGYFLSDEFHPSGGNYWNNHNNSDFFRGEIQNESGSDGISDTPFNISGGTFQDEYPLKQPWTGKLTLIIYVDDNNTNGPWTGSCDHPYKEIQDAVDKATIPGDSVFVYNGTYHEHVIVSQSINLIGENKDTTIIDGNNQVNNAVKIITDWVNISGFTIQNTSATYFPPNDKAGIYIYSGEHNKVTGNIIKNNKYGVYIQCSSNTIISDNLIKNNNWGGIKLYCQHQNNAPHTFDNNIYHNNFLINTPDVVGCNNENNFFDEGYPSGGNYWDDYIGYDSYSGPGQNISGSDGIGDTQYNFSCYQDHYPLMIPWGPPLISNISNDPDIGGFGANITITADITAFLTNNSTGIDTVKINVTYPDNSSKNLTMNKTTNNTYQYNFSDTWINGEYQYIIWATNIINNSNNSTQYDFTITSNATIAVATLKDTYGDDEFINLTDPPSNTPDNQTTSLVERGATWNKYYIGEDLYRLESHNDIINYQDEYHQWHPINISNLTQNIDGSYRINSLPYRFKLLPDREGYLVYLKHESDDERIEFGMPQGLTNNLSDPFYQALPTINETAGIILWDFTDYSIKLQIANSKLLFFYTMKNNQTTPWINMTITPVGIRWDEIPLFNLVVDAEETMRIPETTYNQTTHQYSIYIDTRGLTYPITLDPSLNFYSHAQDAYAEKTSSSYWTAHNATTATTLNNLSLFYIGQRYYSSTYYIDRAYVFFDLLSYPAQASVVNATLRLTPYTDSSSTDFNITIQNGQPLSPHDQPVSQDYYYGNYSGDGGNHTTQGLSIPGYLDIPLNTEGISWLNLNSTTITKLCLRSSRDIGDLPPTTSERVRFNSGSGTSLIICYTFDTNTSVNTVTPQTQYAPYPVELTATGNSSLDNVALYYRYCSDNTSWNRTYENYTSGENEYWQYQGFPWLPPSGSEYQTFTVGAEADNNTFLLRNMSFLLNKTGNGTGLRFNLIRDSDEADIYESDFYPADDIPGGEPEWCTIPTSNCILEQGVTYRILWSAIMNTTSDYINIWRDNTSATYSGGSRWNTQSGEYAGDDYLFIIEGDWIEWDNTGNPDTVYPWNWSFDAPYGYGFYQFFSQGTKYDCVEDLPLDQADAWCNYSRPQSKIMNTGSTNITGYLLIQVQFNDSGEWIVVDDTINETTPRQINAGNQFGLDTVFNGLVNTDDLSSFGDGTYRVYAAFRDPEGNILINDDETEMVASYEFLIDFS